MKEVSARRLIVGNWKMHLGPHEAGLLVERLHQKIKASSNVTVVLCPPFVDVVPVARVAGEYGFKVGVQNLHPEEEGAFTGEISAPMIKDLAEYAILGHSERRRYFFEDDAFIARKVAAAARHDITPILCVGETLLEREHGLS